MSRISGLAELIRLLLLRGELGLGERLVEVHLAARLRAGRGSLREAMRRLEGEGLLVADDEGGMHVLQLGPAEVAATLELRAALEALSAGLAARRVREGRAPAAVLHELEELAPAAPGATPQDAVLADRAFHRAVSALGANRPAHDALNHAWDRLVLAAVHGRWSPRGADAEHRDLLAAILAGDEEHAAAEARRHVLAAFGFAADGYGVRP
jgi:DNA-binding GntR family transcriptional regulator